MTSVGTSLSEVVSQETSRMEAGARIVCRVGLIVGPVLVGLAMLSAVRTVSFLHRCVATTGTVIKVLEQTQHSGNGSPDTHVYYPVFRYVAPDERAFEIRSKSATNPSPFVVGQSVTVLYVPGDESGARLQWFWDLWGLAVTLGGFGAIVLGVGLTARWVFRRMERRGLSIVQ